MHSVAWAFGLSQHFSQGDNEPAALASAGGADPQITAWVDGLGALLEQASAVPGAAAVVVNELQCAAAERRARRSGAAERLQAACGLLGIGAAVRGLAEGARLVQWESSEFDSRHDYCSSSSMVGTFLHPLSLGGVAELRCLSACPLSLLAGSRVVLNNSASPGGRGGF